MKKFGRLFGILAASVFALATMGCPKPEVVKVNPVDFDQEAGTVAINTTVNLSCEDEDVTIYYSTDSTLSSENFEEVGTEGEVFTITESCTLYAIAVNEFGECSKVTSCQYIVAGPSAVVFTVTNVASAEKNTVHAGAKVTLTSEGSVKIYWSNSALTFANYKTAGTEYTAPIDVSTTVGKTVTVYAIAVDADDYTSAIASKTYETVVSYAVRSDSANFELDGNIDDVVAKIGSSTSTVDFSSKAIAIEGYVTMVNEKGQWFVLQDKNAAIEVYTKTDVSGYKPGEYVKLTATKGQLYNGAPEVTAWSGDITKDETKSSTVLYYNNLNGKKDFSGLVDTMILAGLRTDSVTDFNYNDNTHPEAYITTAYESDVAFLGYVTYFSDKSVRLYVMSTLDKSELSSEASTLKNTVSTVYAPATALPGDEIELKTTTPGASVYVNTSKELTADNYSNDGEVKTVSFENKGTYTIYYYAVKEGYNATSGSCKVSVMGENDVSVVFNDIAAIPTDNAAGDSQFTTAKGGKVELLKTSAGQYNPRKSGGVLQLYGKNAMVISNETKSIAAVEFTWSGAPAAGVFVADSGEYSTTTKTWTGLAKSVTFTNTSTSQIKAVSMIITFSDLSVYETDVAFSVADGSLVDAGTTVTLTTTETADIYYSTSTVLNTTNAKTAGTKYTAPITINETTTVSAILVSSDEKTFSKGKSATYTVDATSVFASPVTTLADGDVIYIYHKDGFALTDGSYSYTSKSVTYYKLESKAASCYNSFTKLNTTGLTAVTVKVTGTSYEFLVGGKYLTVTGNNNVTFAAESSDNSKFTVAATAEGANTFYVTGAKGQIEYSNKYFTAYGTGKTTSEYALMFFKVSE